MHQTEPTTTDRIYQRIGEFVVSFQWLEHRTREIGWLLLDPDRHEWPPRHLWGLKNHDLLNRVRQLYVDMVSNFPGDGAAEYCESFGYVIQKAHEARRARNVLVHSAFVELKGGGEVLAIMRVNPQISVDEDGEFTVDSEVLSDKGLTRLLSSLAPIAAALNMHFTQLIHWAPFTECRAVDVCGLPFHRDGLPFAAGGQSLG